jgi:NADH-quinone oxidoreductase subunit D
MEAVIHHFKLWTEGYQMPRGSVYAAIESARGEMGCFLESDDGPKPYRVHMRTPSFTNLQVLPVLAKGHLVADLIALIGTVDIVLGDIDR